MCLLPAAVDRRVARRARRIVRHDWCAIALLQSYSGSKKPFLCMAFDRHERELLLGSESGVLQVIDVATMVAKGAASMLLLLSLLMMTMMRMRMRRLGCSGKPLPCHRSGITALDWHPISANICATASVDTSVKVCVVRGTACD